MLYVNDRQNHVYTYMHIKHASFIYKTYTDSLYINLEYLITFLQGFVIRQDSRSSAIAGFFACR